MIDKSAFENYKKASLIIRENNEKIKFALHKLSQEIKHLEALVKRMKI